VSILLTIFLFLRRLLADGGSPFLQGSGGQPGEGPGQGVLFRRCTWDTVVHVFISMIASGGKVTVRHVGPTPGAMMGFNK